MAEQGNAQVNVSELPAARRKREQRERWRELGFTQQTAWVHDDDLERFRKYVAKLAAKHKEEGE